MNIYDRKAQQSEDAIRKQYSAQRLKLAGQKDQAVAQSGRDINRFSAMTGVKTGAIQKMAGEQQRNLEQGFGDVSAGLKAQEEATVLGAREAERGRQFAASEAEKTRGLEQQKIDLARTQFNKQMRLAFKEFDASKMSQMINAMIALKKGGVGSDEFQEKFLNDQFGNLYDFKGQGRTDWDRWERERRFGKPDSEINALDYL